MRVPEFELERWQSLWEHQVRINVAESGVLPLTVEELAGGAEPLAALFQTPLGYPQTNGSPELRRRIAALYPGAGEGNVLVTNGCAEANFLVCWSLLDPGDRLVMVLPNYMQIAGLGRGFGARFEPWPLREDAGWGPDPERFARPPASGTRLVALCNPNNPTGAVLSERDLQRIVEGAAEAGAWLLADEVYRGAELGDEPAPTAWGRSERVICTGGLSKAYGLPGLRIGWVVGPAALIRRLWSHRDYTSICPAALSDRLAVLALEPARRRRLLERTRGILLRNYPVVRDWVAELDGLAGHHPPEAGAIAWVRQNSAWSSAELVRRLREEHGVLVVPGEQFGVERHLRIGFGGDLGELREALARIGDLLREAGPPGGEVAG